INTLSISGDLFPFSPYTINDPKKMDDQTIVQMIRIGRNDVALNSLYRNFPMIRRIIRSRGGNIKDAEDIFQEALLILLKKVAQPEFHLTAKLSPYLYSVCNYLWNDHLKRKKPEIS